MSRITDYILEPKVVYTEGGFLVRVKVQDDYKYKKYIVSENLHYKTVQGTTFTLTDAEENKQASITEIKGAGTKSSFNLVPVDRIAYSNIQQCTAEYVTDSTLNKIVMHITSGTNTYPSVRYILANRLERGKYYALRFNYKLTLENDPRYK